MNRTLLVAAACTSLAGCVEGLQPAELGLGRRIGVYPGEVAAVLPPMTDRTGNLYVVTGEPDSTGAPQPGTAHTGPVHGGWSDGCSTGDGVRGGARGWIGATEGTGWLWTGTAIIQMDVDAGSCATILDTDPVSQGDLVFDAVAPLVDETISGDFAVAAIRLGADPIVYVVTIDLGLGLIRSSVELGAVDVLATGARGRNEAAFLVQDAAGGRIVLAKTNASTLSAIPVTGELGTVSLVRDLQFGADGTVAAVLAEDNLLIGDRRDVHLTKPAFSAHGIERDERGNIHLVGIANGVAQAARLEGGLLGGASEWSIAMDVDTALAAGVIILDERSGQREATMWNAHAATGGISLVQRFSAPAYAVGARAVFVADPPVDRGGVKYSQLAVVPVGMALP